MLRSGACRRGIWLGITGMATASVLNSPPTQIAEMLAGERERCAKECDEKVAFANHELKASGSHEETRYWIGEHCAATFCADVIRGLGDKA